MLRRFSGLLAALFVAASINLSLPTNTVAQGFHSLDVYGYVRYVTPAAGAPWGVARFWSGYARSFTQFNVSTVYVAGVAQSKAIPFQISVTLLRGRELYNQPVSGIYADAVSSVIRSDGSTRAG